MGCLCAGGGWVGGVHVSWGWVGGWGACELGVGGWGACELGVGGWVGCLCAGGGWVGSLVWPDESSPPFLYNDRPMTSLYKNGGEDRSGHRRLVGRW